MVITPKLSLGAGPVLYCEILNEKYVISPRSVTGIERGGGLTIVYDVDMVSNIVPWKYIGTYFTIQEALEKGCTRGGKAYNETFD